VRADAISAIDPSADLITMIAKIAGADTVLSARYHNRPARGRECRHYRVRSIGGLLVWHCAIMAASVRFRIYQIG
jgi:hypothetical protein